MEYQRATELPRAAAAMAAAKATRADVAGDETENYGVVHMTTLYCGATY